MLSDSRLVRQVLNRGEGPDALWLGLLCLRRKGIGSEIQINTFLPRVWNPHVYNRGGDGSGVGKGWHGAAHHLREQA